MRPLTEILISKLHVKYKFMVFNLELSDDYLSAATIRGMAINRLNTVHTYIVLHTYIHTYIVLHTYIHTYIHT